MKNTASYLSIISIIVLIGLQSLYPADSRSYDKSVAAPEFTHTSEYEWLNSKPLMLKDLRGKVVLVDFWTFGCWNCYRSFPWLNTMEKRLRDKGLQVIGVHTPEFENEKVKENIMAKIKEFKLSHPVMIDNDFSYWRAMGNRYWPAYYIIDKKGYVRASFVGETHEGDPQAKQIEKTIEQLLAEPA